MSDSISNTLIKLDNFLDYVPVISTVTNLVDLFEKTVLSITSLTLVQGHYFKHISDKSTFRCFILLFPVLGNISIALYDLTRPTEKIEITENKPEVIPEMNSEAYYSEAAKFFIEKKAEIDAKTAYDYLERAALDNFAKASTLLGDLHAFGIFVSKDEEKAVEFYLKAHKQGDDTSICNLKRLCTLFGKHFFENQEISKALYYFNISSELGCSSAKVYLGVTHYYGLETSLDLDKAAVLFCDALEIVFKSEETPETISEIDKFRKDLSLSLEKDKKSVYQLFLAKEIEYKNHALLKKSADFLTSLKDLLSVQE